MVAADTAARSGDDEAFAEFQGQLNLIFAKARTLWKDSAMRIHPELAPVGYKLLTFVAHAGCANAHQIVEAFDMDKSAISRQVRMLEEFELLESRPDEQDGRLRVLTPTPEALEKLAELRRDNSHRMRGVLSELTQEEIRTASKVIRLLAEA